MTVADLRRQRAAVPEAAFAQFHACRWGVGEGSWLPAGAWQACVGEREFTDGEPVWVGCDVGGQRSCTALAWVNERLHVACRIYTGDEAILEVADHVRALGRQYAIREFVYDPWRAGQLAQELEREGVTCVQFNQNDQRMVPASERLYTAIVERGSRCRTTRSSRGTPPTPRRSTPAAGGGSPSPTTGRISTGSWRWRWPSNARRSDASRWSCSDGSRVRLVGVPAEEFAPPRRGTPTPGN